MDHQTETNDFEEFSEIVGTKIPEEGWFVYFDKKGFLRGIQGPTKSGYFHHRQIKTYTQAYDFLRAHGRPDLIKVLNRIGFRGNTKERIYK